MQSLIKVRFNLKELSQLICFLIVGFTSGGLAELNRTGSLVADEIFDIYLRIQPKEISEKYLYEYLSIFAFALEQPCHDNVILRKNEVGSVLKPLSNNYAGVVAEADRIVAQCAEVLNKNIETELNLAISRLSGESVEKNPLLIRDRRALEALYFYNMNTDLFDIAHSIHRRHLGIRFRMLNNYLVLGGFIGFLLGLSFLFLQKKQLS